MNTVRRKTRRVRRLVTGWTVLIAASLGQLNIPSTGLPFAEPTCGGELCTSRQPECAAAAQSRHDQRMEQCRVENHSDSACKDEVQKTFVSDIIQCKVTAEEQARFWQAPTANLEAYEYYWRGVEYIERSMFGASVQSLQEVNTQARQLLEKATELDPQFAAAYARLGQTYLQEWFAQGGATPQPLEQAFVLAQKAVALNDSLPLAHIILGQVYIWRRQPELALTHGYRARALALHDPNIAVGMAVILNAVKGGGGEAIGLVEMALRLNPYYPERYLFVLGQAYRWMWSEEAIAAYKKGLARNPDALLARLLLIRTYVEAGQEEEAWAEAAEVLKRDPCFSLESLRQKVAIAVLNPQTFEIFLNSLRKAGLQ